MCAVISPKVRIGCNCVRQQLLNHSFVFCLSPFVQFQFPYWLSVIPVYIFTGTESPYFLTFQAPHSLFPKVVEIELISLFNDSCFSRSDSLKNTTYILLLLSLSSIIWEYFTILLYTTLILLAEHCYVKA